jgi:hypothetical protein
LASQRKTSDSRSERSGRWEIPRRDWGHRMSGPVTTELDRAWAQNRLPHGEKAARTAALQL